MYLIKLKKMVSLLKYFGITKKNTMRKTIINFFAILLTGTSFVSCVEEDDMIPRTGKPVVSLVNKNISVTEGQNIGLDFKFSYAIPEEAHVRIEIVGGTATDHDDFAFDLDTIEEYSDGFFGGNGYFYTIDPDKLTAHLDIETIADALPEGTETLTLKFHSVSKGTILIDDVVNIKIND